jgi:hypothetical protein
MSGSRRGSRTIGRVGLFMGLKSRRRKLTLPLAWAPIRAFASDLPSNVRYVGFDLLVLGVFVIPRLIGLKSMISTWASNIFTADSMLSTLA